MDEIPSDRFDRWRRTSGLVLAPVAFLATWLWTSPSLQPQGRNLSAVLAMVIVLWITEVVPLPVTGVLGPVLCILLGVADARTVLAPFADPIVFLFIGSFMLARAMMLHGLDRRMAMAFLCVPWIGGRPGRVLAALGLVTGLISMWISNSAATAMMLPVALGILETLHQFRAGGAPHSLRTWPYASAMMLMVAYCALVGGIGTPVGSPPNLICIGQLRTLAHVEISFFGWMSVATPVALMMGAAMFVLLYLTSPAGEISAHAEIDLRRYLQEQRVLQGRWTLGQVNAAAAFALAAVLWVMPGILSIALAADHPWIHLFESRVPEAVAAMGAATLLFVLPVDLRQGRFTLSWEEAVGIDWGTILLFGGGLSLGALMFRTGVADALGHGLAGLAGAGSLWTLTAGAIAVAILITEAMSNTAAATMILPVVIAIAQAAHVNPVPPALGATFGASFGFMLPVSAPPNAIVYGSGLVPITRMVRGGILCDIAGFFVILGSLRVLCPLLGFCGY